ncbi:retrovirus-related pol polyprotein from transposon TNT 1-94 [Tanacetum coccineum]
MEILLEPISNKLLRQSVKVKELQERCIIKAFKFSKQQQYEHVGSEVTRSQEGKILQDDDKRLCLVDDLKEVLNHIHINILQEFSFTSLTKQERECKLYDAFDKFTHIKGESLHKYYLRLTQLIIDMNIYNMKMEQFQVNTKFVNSLPPEWNDPIACLNKAVAFLMAIVSSRFSSTNNQLRTSSNLRNHATIQDGRFWGNNASGHAKVVKCYNYKGEGHMARKCTQPKRSKNATWSKDKSMLAKAQEARKFLDEEKLVFLEDPGVPDDQAVQTIIPNNAAFQTENLDTYDFDCDDISNAKAILRANISNYGSDVISEEKTNKEQNNESVTAELERYKERVKTFEQRLNIDLSSREKMTDSQMDDMIKEKLTLKEQVDSLEFDNVVKIRSTLDARTEGKWGFEHTKAVFNNEIIPFVKSLKDIFNEFDKDLLNEITEVQTVFDQMDTVVQ